LPEIMQISKPRVTPLFLSSVQECKDAGVELAPEEIVWIYHAADKVTGESGNQCPPLLEIPVCVGKLTLYPLTIGALMWWQNYGGKWYRGDKEMEIVAIGYCMAEGRNPGAFASMTNKARADAALIAWQVSDCFAITLKELKWAIERVDGQLDYAEIDSPNEHTGKASTSDDWGVIIAQLCATYHQPPEYFLWRISESASTELYRNIPKTVAGWGGETEPLTRAQGELIELVRHLKQRGNT
jgi:hypothetical protein